MKRTMVVAALMGLGFGPFAAGAHAQSNNPGTNAPYPAPSASAPASPAPSNGNPVAVEQEEVMSAPFTVKSVDRAKRHVVVESPDGARSTVNISPDATGFDTLKQGDQVALDYYKSSVVSLAPGGASAATSSTPTRTNTPMATPKGHHEVTTSARVSHVDTDKGTIQVTTSDGQPQTLYVQDPMLQKQMRTLKPGEHVQVTYVEPMAVALHPASTK